MNENFLICKVTWNNPHSQPVSGLTITGYYDTPCINISLCVLIGTTRFKADL